MTIFDNGYVQNVLSNFIFWFITSVFAWLIYVVTRRQPKLRFFNIAKSKRIVIYLGQISIPSGSAIGLDRIPRSYQGGAVAVNELMLITPFQRLFNVIVPGTDSLSGFLKFLTVSDVDVEILPSPFRHEEVERSTTIIAVGSPAFNIASRRIEDDFKPYAYFDAETGHIKFGDRSENDSTISFVQRVYDAKTKQVAFYVAGSSVLGTNGAVYFLLSQWDYLARKYPGNEPFCVMLKIESNDGKRYSIVFEK